MKLAQLVFIGMLMHLATANSLFNKIRDKIDSAFDNNQDPHLWEKSGKFEGDMVLTEEQEEELLNPISARNGNANVAARWPNKKMPYEFSSTFPIKEKHMIEKVIDKAFRNSCFSVVPRTNEVDYVRVVNDIPGQCSSYVGYINKGPQNIHLGNGCYSDGVIVHEFLHAAGFDHQHSASDRDNYVTIHTENIEKGYESNFNSTLNTKNFGVPYDYGSLMHYSATAFSRNGKPTIVPKKNVTIGQATKPSKSDMEKLNRMYEC